MLGRPNVGKSSLINKLLGKDRLIIQETPGTTRDAIDVPFERDDLSFLLIDTAGVRRAARIGRGLEQVTAMESLRQAKAADVVWVVLDGNVPAARQDARLAALAMDAMRPTIVVANKIDLLPAPMHKKLVAHIRGELAALGGAPLLLVSARTGLGLNELLSLSHELYAEAAKLVAPNRLRHVFDKIAAGARPPTMAGVRPELRSLVQARGRPPTFILKVDRPRLLATHYVRYVENQLREQVGFERVPIRVQVRRG